MGNWNTTIATLYLLLLLISPFTIFPSLLAYHWKARSGICIHFPLWAKKHTSCNDGTSAPLSSIVFCFSFYSPFVCLRKPCLLRLQSLRHQYEKLPFRRQAFSTRFTYGFISFYFRRWNGSSLPSFLEMVQPPRRVGIATNIHNRALPVGNGLSL